jgi:thiamine biosynthesis lipoprotein
VALILLLVACCAAAVPQRFEYSEVAMGGRARIVVYAQDRAMAERACRDAFARIAFLEDIMSDYRPTSEISRLCAEAGGPSVKVTPELFLIMQKSRELSRRSGGAFDVTVGPLVKLWRKARKTGVLPTQDEINAVRLRRIGWHRMSLDSEASTVQLEVPGMQLDLGGIAKGYACDEAMRILKQAGIKSALVEVGGDMVVSGPPPGKMGWEIEVLNAGSTFNVQRSGFKVQGSTSKVRGSGANTATLVNCAISSSGDTEQYIEIGGVRYSHIVDPRTGIGLTDRIAVTVIAPNGVTSDGLSTAVSVLGAKRGRTLAATYPGVSVYIRTVLR